MHKSLHSITRVTLLVNVRVGNLALCLRRQAYSLVRHAPPALYGAVFYFDHEEDYVRCRTMAESFTVLEPLLSVEIP